MYRMGLSVETHSIAELMMFLGFKAAGFKRICREVHKFLSVGK